MLYNDTVEGPSGGFTASAPAAASCSGGQSASTFSAVELLAGLLAKALFKTALRRWGEHSNDVAFLFKSSPALFSLTSLFANSSDPSLASAAFVVS